MPIFWVVVNQVGFRRSVRQHCPGVLKSFGPHPGGTPLAPRVIAAFFLFREVVVVIRGRSGEPNLSANRSVATLSLIQVQRNLCLEWGRHFFLSELCRRLPGSEQPWLLSDAASVCFEAISPSFSVQRDRRQSPIAGSTAKRNQHALMLWFFDPRRGY